MRKVNFFLFGVVLAIVLPIILLIAFVIFSVNNSFELVEHDYYRKELKYQHQIDKELRTNQLSQTVSIVSHNFGITIEFPDIFSPELISGNIQLFRPSDSKLDFSIPIELSKNGEQLINNKKLENGLWIVKIFWQVQQNEYFTKKRIMIDRPM